MPKYIFSAQILCTSRIPSAQKSFVVHKIIPGIQWAKNGRQTLRLDCYWGQVVLFVGCTQALLLGNWPFAASDHVVQNPPCWRASSLLSRHWDIKTKRPEPVKLDLFWCPSAGIIMSLPSSMADFCTTWSLAAKSLLFCVIARSKHVGLGRAPIPRALTALLSKTSVPKRRACVICRALSLSISFVANRRDLACHAFLYWSRW